MPGSFSGSRLEGDPLLLLGSRFESELELFFFEGAASTAGAAAGASALGASGAGATGAGAGLGGLTNFKGSRSLMASPYFALAPSQASLCLNLMAIRMP